MFASELESEQNNLTDSMQILSEIKTFRALYQEKTHTGTLCLNITEKALPMEMKLLLAS